MKDWKNIDYLCGDFTDPNQLQNPKANKIEPIFKKLTIVKKGWGEERHIDNQPGYCGKLLCFNKGKKMSLHAHDVKEETFYILSGKIIFRYLDLENADLKEIIMSPEEIVYIPRLSPHQIEALEDSVILECSTHDESSDSYRYAKGDSQNE